MRANDYLNEAKAVISDSDKNFSNPSHHLHRTARLWSAYLDLPMEAHQVAACMGLVGLARSMDSNSVDTWIQALSYIAVAGEMKEGNDLYV